MEIPPPNVGRGDGVGDGDGFGFGGFGLCPPPARTMAEQQMKQQRKSVAKSVWVFMTCLFCVFLWLKDFEVFYRFVILLKKIIEWKSS